MSEKIIEVSGLQKSYKENHVLKDVSFTIDKGSIFALPGSMVQEKRQLSKSFPHY